ncbi:MAG: TraR/DksA C4-type zinc finger protein [Planctomycetota bacterium]
MSVLTGKLSCREACCSDRRPADLEARIACLGRDSLLDMPLSERSRRILKQIAAGKTYEQILQSDPELSYPDIFAAAKEALSAVRGSSSRPKRLTRSPPATSGQWTADDDALLRSLTAQGQSDAAIAGKLQRKPRAVRDRKVLLELVPQTADEPAREKQAGAAAETATGLSRAALCEGCGILIPASRLRAGAALCVDCQAERERTETGDGGPRCPRCGGRLVERYAGDAEGTGYYLGCSAYPDCRHTE